MKTSSIRTILCSIILICCNLNPFVAFSQGLTGNESVDKPTYKFTDRYGNTVPLSTINPKGSGTAPNQRTASAAAAAQQCNAGYFLLTFNDDGSGTGFYDATPYSGITLGEARRNVVCQVFSDMSQLIIPRGSPAVKIEVNGYTDMTSGAAASASSYTLALNGQAPGGIIDWGVWSTINTGVDAWTGTPAAGGFHGVVNVNFRWNYFLDFTQSSTAAAQSAIGANQIDFYSVLLHESIHALGFGSYIKAQGGAYVSAVDNTSAGRYTRFDSYLTTITGSPIIQNSNSCYGTSINTANTSTLANVCSSTSQLQFRGPNTTTVPGIVIKSGPFSAGTTFSHLDENCNSSSGDMMMTGGIPLGSGSVLRVPDQRVVKILCDLGYNISGTYGSNPAYTSIYRNNYGTCNQTTIAGVNDLLPGSVQAGNSLTINYSSIAGNDINSDQVACLSVLSGGTLTGPTTLSSGGSVTFNANSSFTGTAILQYVPKNTLNATKFGNITFIFINVSPANLPPCSNDQCNLVCNGDYEGITAGNAGNLSNYRFGGQNTPDIRTSAQAGGNEGWNCNQKAIPAPHGGNTCMGFFGYSATTGEGVMFKLKQPMLAGHTYRVGFWGRLNDLQQLGFVNILGSATAPCDASTASNYPPATTTCGGNTFAPVIIGKPNVSQNTSWQFYSVTYTPTTSLNYIMLFGSYQTSTCGYAYFYTDDVEVREIGVNVTANPSTISNGQSSTLSVVNPDPNCVYSWSPSGSLSSANGTTVGATPSATTTYTVTRTCSGVCSGIGEVVVTVDNSNVFSVSIAANPTTICAGASTTLTANPNPAPNSSVTYTYKWNDVPGSTTRSISATTSGTYIVTVTNAGGQTATASIVITVNPLPTVTASANPTSVCVGDPSVLTASGGTTYSWSNSVNGNTQTVRPTSTTTYTVTATSSGGCKNTASVVVNVNPLPTITATASPTLICGGDTSKLTASGGVQYTWSGGGITVSGNPVLVTPTVTTTYTVTGTNANGCKNTATVVIRVNPAPIANAGLDRTICSGSCTTLGYPFTQIPVIYRWTPTTGLLTPNAPSTTACPTASTVYTLTSRNTLTGCTSHDDVTVRVAPAPTIQVRTKFPVICAGSSSTIYASGGVTYTWTNGVIVVGTGSPITVSPSVTTTYTVTGVDQNGCSGTASIVIQVIPSPIANAGLDKTICSGSCTSIGFPFTQLGVTYRWTPNTALSAPNSSSTIACPTATTTYTLTATNNFNGCSSQDQVVVNVNSTPVVTATANPSVICAGSSSVLTATGGVNYRWRNNNNNTIIFGNPVTVTPAVTTTYSVTVTSSTGCTNTGRVIVNVNPTPVITATANPPVICSGSSTTLTASGGVSYTWSNGGTTTFTGNPVVVSPTVTTTYTVTGTNVNGCKNTAFVVVRVNPAPIANAGTDKTVCAGSCTTIGSPLSQFLVTYRWTPTSGLLTPNSPSTTACPTATTTYTLVARNRLTGCTATDQVIVNVNPRPNILVRARPTVICAGSSTTLFAFNAGNYVWRNGVIVVGTGTPITVSPTVTTTYTVTGDLNGCSSTASIVIQVNPSPIAIAGPDKTICSGSCTSIGFPFTQLGVTYSWTPNTALSAPNSSSTIACPTATTTYTLTSTNRFTGCSSQDQVVVNVNSKPVVTVNANPPAICAGGSSTLTATGGVIYKWGNSSNSVVVGGNPIIVTPLVTTTYTVTVTNSSGCTNTGKVVVTVGNGGWPNTAGGPNETTQGHSVVTDAQGNVYVAGSFDNTSITFKTTTINAGADGNKFYLVKYDACGNFRWVAYGTRDGSGRKVYVDVDPTGSSVYIANTTGFSMSLIDGTNAPSSYSFGNGPSAFVAQFATGNGALLGFNAIVGPPTAVATSLPHGLTVTSNGVYLAYEQTFAGNTKKSIVEFNAGLTAALNGVDVTSINAFALNSSIDSDPNGNIFLGGAFTGTLLNTTVTTTGAVLDMFIVKFNPALSVLWAQSGNSTPTTTVRPTGIYVNRGGIYLTGIFSANGGGLFNGAVTGNGGFLTRYNDLITTGSRVWGVQTANRFPVAVGADASANVYTVGNSFVEHRSAANGGAVITTAINAGNGFDVFYNSSLTNPAFFVTGSFNAPVTIGSTAITPLGLEDMYTARIMPGTGAYFRTENASASEGNDLKDTPVARQFNVDVHPNPVANITALDITLETKCKVDISVVDITGKVMRRLSGSEYEAGVHSINIDCSDLAAGIYFIQIKTPDRAATKKVVKL